MTGDLCTVTVAADLTELHSAIEQAKLHIERGINPFPIYTTITLIVDESRQSFEVVITGDEDGLRLSR